MSDELYPVAMIKRVRTLPANRVIKDKMGAGKIYTQRRWPAQYFRRQFEVVHEKLTEAEFNYLLNFWELRSGASDSFWFRDNVNRRGNAKVVFVEQGIDYAREGQHYSITLMMEETEALRALPNIIEVRDAAGDNSPLVWYDAHRLRRIVHMDVTTLEEDFYDTSGNGYVAYKQGDPYAFDSEIAYANAVGFGPNIWQRTTQNFSQFLSGPGNACSIFVIGNVQAQASQKVLISVGDTGAGKAVGIQITAGNQFAPWVGAAEVWTNAVFTNSTQVNRSLCATWAGNSSTGKLYVNGALIGSDSNSRAAYVTGPVTLGASPTGTLKMEDGIWNHFLVFNYQLTLSQIQALHNLFAYQYGMATV